jgi:hypothetical protein
MIKVAGFKTKSDTDIIMDFTRFCLGRYLTPEQIDGIRVIVTLADPKDLPDQTEAEEFSDICAYMVSEGVKYKKPTYSVFIKRSSINNRAKDDLVRLKVVMKYLAHELVHVKQYATGEMVDIWEGDEYIGTRFKGEMYLPEHKYVGLVGKWAYWDSPYEVEAYGRMEGLYLMYVESLNSEEPCLTSLSKTPTP